MTQVCPTLHLDPSPATSNRGGFTVSGLAVGDIIQDGTHPGAELVATTLDGDLFVFDISGGSVSGTPIVHTWVDAALGAYNGILIDDLDAGATGNELYIGSSQGIFKWVQN